MPQNKRFKKVALLICIIAFGYSACQNKKDTSIEIDPSPSTKTAYEFNDPKKELADILTDDRKFEDAIELYSMELKNYERASNWEGIVYSYDRLGYFYRRIGEDSLSNISFIEGIRLAKIELPRNHILLSKTYFDEARRAWGKSNYELAISNLDSAYRVYNSSVFFDKGLEESIVNYKYYSYDRSAINYDSAIKYLDIRRLNDTLIESKPGKLYGLFADYSSTYRKIGDYQRAIAYGQEAFKIALDNVGENGEGVIDVLESQFYLGAAYYDASDFENAVSISETLLAYYAETGINDVNRQIQYLNVYALGLQGLDNFEKASNQFSRIIDLLEANNLIDETYYWSAVLNLGRNYYLDDKIDEGGKLLFRALQENQKLYGKLHPNNVPRFNVLGGFMTYIDEHEKALAYYDSAMRSAIPEYKESINDLPIVKKIDLTYEQLLVVERKLQEFRTIYESTSEIELLQAILKYADFVHSILIQNRRSYEASQGKLFLSEDFKEMYATAIDANYILYGRSIDEKERAKYAGNVAELMNRSKAVLFLEQSGEYELVRSANISRKVKEEYYLLLNNLDSLDEAFYSLTEALGTSDSIRIINSERMVVNAKLTDLKEKVFELIESPDTDSVLDRKNAIATSARYFDKNKETAIVEYFVFGDAIYTVSFFDKTVKLYKTESDDQFKMEFGALLEEISNKPSFKRNRESFEIFRASAFSLQQKLLGEVLKDLNGLKSRLIIIPDNYLSKLPFEVLLKSEKASSYFDAEYLIRDFEISYSLSTDLIGIDEVSKRAPNKMIGFGYSGEMDVDSRSPLGALPGAIEEINYLKENVKGNYYVGIEGSKLNFLSSARNYDIIHLAIHGISDSTDRYNSRLIFNGTEGNVLQTKDIYLANLDSRLVVLSACESGVGEINEGEGTFSIARGFALTGTEAIVMSLWKVDDNSSAQLMVDFYAGINRKETVSTALIGSKKSYLANADEYSSHPYYWSSFVMLGEDINLASNRNNYWMYALTLILLVILVSWQSVKKKRAN